MAAVSMSDLQDLVQQEATKQGVDPTTAKGMLLSENSYFDSKGVLQTKDSVDPTLTSPKGASGVMQTKPSTVYALQKQGYLDPTTDMTTPEGQVAAGVATIKEIQSRVGKDPFRTAAAYNGGNAASAAYAGGKPMPSAETTDYLKKFAQQTGLKMDVNAGAGRGAINPDPAVMADLGSPDITSPADSSNRNTTSSLVKQGTSVTTHTLPPGLATQINTDSDNTHTFINNIMPQLKGLSDKLLGNVTTESNALDAQAAAKTATSSADSQILLAQQQKVSDIARTFGLDVDDPNSIVSQNTKTMQQTEVQRAQLQSQINTLQNSSSFTSDPIGWFMNNVKALPMIQQHNALVSQENNAEQAIIGAQRLATNQTPIQPANISAAIMNKQMASAQQNIADANLEKAKIVGPATAMAMRSLLEQSSLLGSTLHDDAMLAQMTGTHTTVSTGTADRDTEAQKGSQNDLVRVNSMMTALGAPTFASIYDFNKLPKEVQQKLVTGAQQNAPTKDNPNPSMSLGTTPGDAVSTIQQAFGSPGIAAMARSQNAPQVAGFVKELVAGGTNSYGQLVSQAGTAGPASGGAMAAIKMAKNPEDVLKLGIDTYMAPFEKEMHPGIPGVANSDGKGATNMAALSPMNPYRFQPKVASAIDSLKDNPYAQFVAKLPPGAQPTDQLIMSRAVADAQVPGANVGQIAQQVSDFYTKGYTNQVQEKGMRLLGFDVPSKYPVSLKINGFTPTSADLRNPISVQRLLVTESVNAATAALYKQNYLTGMQYGI